MKLTRRKLVPYQSIHWNHVPQIMSFLVLLSKIQAGQPVYSLYTLRLRIRSKPKTSLGPFIHGWVYKGIVKESTLKNSVMGPILIQFLSVFIPFCNQTVCIFILNMVKVIRKLGCFVFFFYARNFDVRQSLYPSYSYLKHTATGQTFCFWEETS